MRGADPHAASLLAVMRLALAMSMPPRIGGPPLHRNAPIRQATRSLRTAAARLASAAVLEAPAVVAGLDDVAMVREAVEQRRGHLGVAEDTGPFTEGKIGGDDD